MLHLVYKIVLFGIFIENYKYLHFVYEKLREYQVFELQLQSAAPCTTIAYVPLIFDIGKIRKNKSRKQKNKFCYKVNKLYFFDRSSHGVAVGKTASVLGY